MTRIIPSLRRRSVRLVLGQVGSRLAAITTAALIFVLIAVGFPLLVNAQEQSNVQTWEYRVLYFTELTFIGNEARATVRAARGLSVGAVSWGGAKGNEAVFSLPSRPLAQEQTITFVLPLNGPVPSLVFPWRDEYGNTGILTLRSDLIPHPLPSVDTSFCRLKVNWLRWRPGIFEGGVQIDECTDSTNRIVPVVIEQGYVETRTLNAKRRIYPLHVTGTLTVTHPESKATVQLPLTSSQETLFALPTNTEGGFQNIVFLAELINNVNVGMPNYVNTAHFPAWNHTYLGRSSFICGTTSQHRYWTHDLTIPAHIESQPGAPWTSNQDWPEIVPLITGLFADATFAIAPPPPDPPETQTQPGAPLDPSDPIWGWGR